MVESCINKHAVDGIRTIRFQRTRLGETPRRRSNYTVVVLGIDSILSQDKLPRLNDGTTSTMQSRSLKLRRPEHKAAGNTQTEKGSSLSIMRAVMSSHSTDRHRELGTSLQLKLPTIRRIKQ